VAVDLIKYCQSILRSKQITKGLTLREHRVDGHRRPQLAEIPLPTRETDAQVFGNQQEGLHPVKGQKAG